MRWLVSPRATLTAMAFVAMLVLTACGQEERAAQPDPTGPDAAFNDVDVQFLTGMIPHHQQAVEMAEMVPERTERAELRQLAVAIVETQNEEIDTMEGLLARSGTQAPGGGGHQGEGHEGGQMPGMMDDAQMRALAAAEGDDFDRMFIEMMTAHHEGAIQTAEQELQDGQNPDVKDLARQIIDAQRAEIDQMRRWKQEWAL